MKTACQKTFVFDKITAFFKHTDCYGFVHPYNFFEWTSYVREAFFQQTVQNFEKILSRPIKMMTVKIAATMFSDTKFGNTIEAKLTVARIKKVSFDMVIRFYNQQIKKVVCETVHTIVFVDSRTGVFADIPIEMKEVIVNYEEFLHSC
jgi:acyl-CoA thioesterase FadM